MRVYLGKDRTHATGTMTATHETVAGLITSIQNVGHKLYTDFFLWYYQTKSKGQATGF
jgi:hypothetical protein